uniref:Cationic amino acid transporter C-terminal domain-containing protein n=1 Tax=Glossina palpalis gambiensis TaxID=67801 RepID=A0A1B0BB70_9MUSC
MLLPLSKSNVGQKKLTIKCKVPLPPGITSATLIPKLIRTKDVKQLQDGKAQTAKPKLTVLLDLDLIITENLIFKILNFRFYFFEKLCAGMYVTKLVGLMFGLIFFLDLFAAIGLSGGFAIFIYFILFIGIFVILLIISRQPQNRYALAFLTPGLPFIPAIAITVNIYLIFKLSILTLVRFTIWMSLGFVMYFYYGITHSTLEQTTEELELKVDKDYNKNRTSREEKAVWDQPSYMNQNHEPVWASKDNTQQAATKQSTSKFSIYVKQRLVKH